MISVIGIDPGLQTGVCEIEIEDGIIKTYNLFEWDFGQYCDWIKALTPWAMYQTDLTIACERFTITPKTPAKEAHWSIENTGIAKEWCRVFGANWFDARPAETKPLITNNVLKAGGLYVPSKGHALDSVRVALYYLITKRKMLEECLREPA